MIKSALPEHIDAKGGKWWFNGPLSKHCRLNAINYMVWINESSNGSSGYVAMLGDKIAHRTATYDEMFDWLNKEMR